MHKAKLLLPFMLTSAGIGVILFMILDGHALAETFLVAITPAGLSFMVYVLAEDITPEMAKRLGFAIPVLVLLACGYYQTYL